MRHEQGEGYLVWHKNTNFDLRAQTFAVPTIQESLEACKQYGWNYYGPRLDNSGYPLVIYLVINGRVAWEVWSGTVGELENG